MLHGGDLARAIDTYGFAADDRLDLSTGINPIGDPPIEGFPGDWPVSAFGRLRAALSVIPG